MHKKMSKEKTLGKRLVLPLAIAAVAVIGWVVLVEFGFFTSREEGNGHAEVPSMPTMRPRIDATSFSLPDNWKFEKNARAYEIVLEELVNIGPGPDDSRRATFKGAFVSSEGTRSKIEVSVDVEDEGMGGGAYVSNAQISEASLDRSTAELVRPFGRPYLLHLQKTLIRGK